MKNEENHHNAVRRCYGIRLGGGAESAGRLCQTAKKRHAYGLECQQLGGLQTCSLVEGDGAKALHFTEINAKYGFCWVNWQRYPAKAGDVVKVTAKVKGSGFAWVQLQTCLADGKYTGAIPQSVIRLTPEWRDVEIEIAVTDIKDKVTGKVMLTFGAKKGADFYISHIKADLTDGK